MEGLPTVVAADWIPFIVANVGVCGEEDPKRVACWKGLEFYCVVGGVLVPDGAGILIV